MADEKKTDQQAEDKIETLDEAELDEANGGFFMNRPTIMTTVTAQTIDDAIVSGGTFDTAWSGSPDDQLEGGDFLRTRPGRFPPV